MGFKEAQSSTQNREYLIG
jgi:hypothetical protein